MSAALRNPEILQISGAPEDSSLLLCRTIPARNDGFTLIEVLVTLIVLSVGLLGLAALQTIGTKLNFESSQRTQAVIQLYDMADRIRANPVARAAGSYDTVISGYLPSSPPNCLTGACSATEMAAYDIYQWNTSNGQLLSNGKGEIASDSSTGVLIRTLTVRWTEKEMPMSLSITLRD